MAVFIALLFVVEAYVWMKGGFEWSVRRLGRSRRDAGLRLAPDDRDDPYERGREEAARAG